MAKQSQVDKMIAVLEDEIAVRQFALTKLREAQKKAPSRKQPTLKDVTRTERAG